MRDIAKDLNVSHTIILPEIKRNRCNQADGFAR